jgi:hypothetical protein
VIMGTTIGSTPQHRTAQGSNKMSTMPVWCAELLGKLDAFAIDNKDAHNRLEKSLYGNGHGGLLDRATRMEDNIEKITKQQDINTKAISDLGQDIRDLATIVKAHHEDKALHSLLGLSARKEAVIWIAVVFVILHTVVSIFPDLTILLRFLLHLAGVNI